MEHDLRGLSNGEQDKMFGELSQPKLAKIKECTGKNILDTSRVVNSGDVYVRVSAGEYYFDIDQALVNRIGGHGALLFAMDQIIKMSS